MSPATKQEIKEWLEAEYAEAQGPFTAEKVGAPDFIIMRTSDLDELETDLTEDELRILDKGYTEAQQGKTRDAFESLAEIRDAYYEDAPLTEVEKDSLLAGYDDCLNGRVLDFDEAMSQIAAKYGL